MNQLDRKILNIIQSQFPVCAEPYGSLAKSLGIEEDVVFDRVQELASSGIIRRLGCSFDSAKLGHRSCLVATEVLLEQLDSAAQQICKHAEVTHCYSRNHRYNLWFTLIAQTDQEIDRLLAQIASVPGVCRIQKLPATKLFKINASFAL